jgi:hypothetical protein
MATLKRTSLPLLLLLLGVLGCVLPQVSVTDPSANATSVAETVDFIMMMTRNAAQPVDVISSDTPTALPTLTVTWTAEPTFTLPPTLTQTPTSTFTPTFTPTFLPTATSILPMVSVSVPTNCRVGPGKVYTMVGALLAGRTVPVYGRTPDGAYWYIRNPDVPNDFCWIWGEYATVTGLTSGVPIFTPPPSPTPTNTATPSPGFTASYDGLDSCNGWYVDILLKNTGSLTFKSISITVKDNATDVVVTAMNDGFANYNGCNSTERDNLLAGKNVIVSSPTFGYNPGGHKLKATVTLCSQTGLNGSCITDVISFKP